MSLIPTLSVFRKRVILSIIILTLCVAVGGVLFSAAKSNAYFWSDELIGKNVELVSYENAEGSYTFKHPALWNVYAVSSMSYMRLENLEAQSLESQPKDIQRQYFKIEMVKLSAKGLPLDEWVTRQNTTSYPLPKVVEQRNIEVDGHPAIYQVEQFGSFVHPVIFIEKGNFVYILNISSAADVFEPLIKEFIENFSFEK